MWLETSCLIFQVLRYPDRTHPLSGPFCLTGLRLSVHCNFDQSIFGAILALQWNEATAFQRFVATPPRGERMFRELSQAWSSPQLLIYYRAMATRKTVSGIQAEERLDVVGETWV